MEQVGRYEIKRELGRGGMSTVYLAHDPRFERQVAVKLLPREFLHDPGFQARFTREARVIAQLEHPAIVPVYDFGEQAGQPYLVMRYMSGGTLKERTQKGRLGEAEVVQILGRVASALDEAHRRGIVHRDVKPDNILFDLRGDAYLSDFGIVKLAEQTGTYSGGVLGTPAYMSPEQARGDADIDGRSDVYALGAILYELLSGQPPYEADTPMGLAVKHITEPVPRIRELRPEVAETVEALILRAMDKEREERHATAEALVEGLRDAIPEAPTHTPRKSMPTIVGVDEPERDRTRSPADDEQPTRLGSLPRTLLSPGPGAGRRARVWGLGALGALLLAAVALAVIMWPAGPLPQPTQEPTGGPAAAAVARSPTPNPSPTIALPPVSGPDPSYRVGTFYYPWYGNPEVNGDWVHWESGDLQPPEVISSDYYPLLGPYSSNDRQTVAQHFAWLRSAGVGVVITSWWGQGSYEDRAVPLLLEMAERYGLKVAFHLEPYDGRNAESLVDDVEYIERQYGEHAGFLRVRGESRWIHSDARKGVYFLWAPDLAGAPGTSVEPEYWDAAVDHIHNLPQPALVLAATTAWEWVDRGGFDGLYNYVSLDHDPGQSFAWAASLPPGAWYVPSVAPGFSARRIGYAEETHLPRLDGETYLRQFAAAMEAGLEPAMLTITSFNEWHEGTQIEPALAGFVGGGFEYDDYGGVGETGYLTLTRDLVDEFQASQWPERELFRVFLTTTSDWTEFGPVEGARLTWPEFVSVSEQAAPLGPPGMVGISQELADAQAGGRIEMEVVVGLIDLDPGGEVTFLIAKGDIGITRVELYHLEGDQERLVETFVWGGNIPGDGRNHRTFVLPTSMLLSP